MATKKPRINVTLEEPILAFLQNLARQENKSIARLIKELTLEALEMRDDFYLSKLAEQLDKKGTKTYGHNQAWK